MKLQEALRLSRSPMAMCPDMRCARTPDGECTAVKLPGRPVSLKTWRDLPDGTRIGVTYQGDEIQFYVGTFFHHLAVRDGALKMTLKRVNLLNCDAALPAVQLFI